MKLEFSEHSLRFSIDLVDLGASSKFLIEFVELRSLVEKIRSKTVF
jgi:hypothetical protein